MANPMPSNDALATAIRKAGYERGTVVICVFLDCGVYTPCLVEAWPGATSSAPWTLHSIGTGESVARRDAGRALCRLVTAHGRATIPPVFIHREAGFWRREWVLVDSELNPRSLRGQPVQIGYNPI